MFRIKALFGGALVAVVLLVAGCSNGPSAGSGKTQAGGSITVAAAQGIPQLNPAIRTFAWEEVLFPLLWNGLTKTDESGKIVPDLSESWKGSEDQKTWTFTLRKGVTFSSGKAFTADDVVKSFKYYLDKGTATQEKNKISDVTDVIATNPQTVTITLAKPIATFPAAIVWVKMLDMASLGSIDRNPIGTGPYVVTKFTPNNTITLKRNAKYFGTPGTLDAITIATAAESTAAVTGLRSGDIDVLWSVPSGDVAQFKTDSSITLVRPKNPSQWPSWEVDTTSAPFDNVKARQALAFATDRQAILDAAYNGQGVVSKTNDPLSELNPWFGGNLTDYSYNLDKAKALFAEAGVKSGDTLTWWGVAGSYPEWSTSGQILQASLKKIGISLVIDPKDIGTWVAKFYPAGKKYPATIVPNFQSTPPEPAYSINFYLKGRCECNWSNNDFTTAFNGAVAEPDAAMRKAKWSTVQEIINQQVPLIVPLQSTVVTATSKKVTGVWTEGGGQLHLESASLAKS